jgi:hypothetical protein
MRLFRKIKKLILLLKPNKKKTQTKSDTPRTTKSKTKYEPKQTESDVPKLRGKRTTASTKK